MQNQGLIARLLKHEAAGGVVLIIAAILALIVANSGFSPAYDAFLGAKLSVLINGDGLSKPLILWINDGLMALFFFLIGLELKHEMVEGRLKNPRDVMLPGMAAAGGMVAPAIAYAAINWTNPETLRGWAIPAATDIAFAVGVLALLGRRVPAALKIFLLTLAILDDLGAILVIALFYTADLKLGYLVAALLPIAGMALLNRAGAHRVAPMLILGAVLWVLVLKSGVHATLAGVVTAFFVPIRDRFGKSPLHALEHALQPYVTFGVVPIFAFANAGVVLGGLSLADLADPVPLGIVAGLVLGKQVGVFGVTWLMVRMGWARLPDGVSWLHLYGIACLAGIGFTMSLFIGSLSFTDPLLMNKVRLGVLCASLVSAVLGFALLRAAPDARSAEAGKGRATAGREGAAQAGSVQAGSVQAGTVQAGS